ncbi:prephenate dehydratase [Shivajiella indica]|uniref:prephenate dehydratase n=1 Tax=Shivajiella indica TaxID=872115 RepID=A0ABW5BBI3_9BACT
MKIAIQGIPGSFHHQVAINLFGKGGSISTYRTFEEVAKSIYSEIDEVGVMAIENSIAGAILPNYELIDRYGLVILGEYYLPISHNLMVLPGQRISEIFEVRSHPMALLQCKIFFQDYPRISLIDDVDTATVAKRIAEEKIKGLGAIASKTAAEIYQLEILAEDIQTVQNNFTRFIILGKQKGIPDFIPNKASLKVTIRNEKGSLAKLLTLMSENDLDLSKIQSIPVIDKPWDYAFFIDTQFENYHTYIQVLNKIIENGGEVKVFGEYLSNR